MALHCPSTLVIAYAGTPGQAGRFAASLRDRRVAAVYGDSDAAAATAAEGLGVPVRPFSEPRLDDGSPDELRGRLREALLAVADQFRGETVLVVTGDGRVPRLAAELGGHLPRAGRAPDTAPPVVIEVGDEGFQVVSWPGPGPAPGSTSALPAPPSRTRRPGCSS